MGGSQLLLFWQQQDIASPPDEDEVVTTVFLGFWEKILVTKVRVLINDTEEPQIYTDARLEQIVVYAATLVQLEIDLNTTYIIDIETVTISPDPIQNSDNAFCTLVALKAACITDQGTYRNAALIGGIKANCGPSMINTNKYMAGFRDLVSFNCEAYERQKASYQIGNQKGGQSVLSPFNSNNYNPL